MTLNNTNDSSLTDNQSIDWAKQAYLELKRKQKEKKELLKKESEEIDNKDLREQGIPLGEEIWNNLAKNTILYDLIYTPRPTKWLKLGKKKNCLTIDGLEMLVHQGALSLKLWSGLDDIPIEIMKLSAKKHLMN